MAGRDLGGADCPLDVCLEVLRGDRSTKEKREALSSIGRKRQSSNKPVLFEYAYDANPQVAMQAIRGLLVFKDDSDVREFLAGFADHPNDMMRDVISVELGGLGPAASDHCGSPNHMRNVVVVGDTMRILGHVPDGSVHLTFTSPPYYNARDYSVYGDYAGYLDFLTGVFGEVHRITKEGRFFVLNTSPIIIPRAGRRYASRRYAVPFDIHARMAGLGWEFVDDIVWAKPEKSAKNRISTFSNHRRPLAYKPNPRTEYLMVYRKKTHRLIDWNIRQYGKKQLDESLVGDGYERSNVWNIAPTRSREHSAVFPVELCNQIVKLYSFKGDLVFDPFAGSGTVGASSVGLGRYFFLNEVSRKYAKVMAARLQHARGFHCISVQEFESISTA